MNIDEMVRQSMEVSRRLRRAAASLGPRGRILYLNRIGDKFADRTNSVHFLSKSIPRSGHHFLVQTLGGLWGRNFKYCEFYNPSRRECCKARICTRCCSARPLFENEPAVSLQKSHDFGMIDSRFVPNRWLKYIIQYRDFGSAIKSDLKLQMLSHYSSMLLKNGISVRDILYKHDKDLYCRALSLIDAEKPAFHADMAKRLIDSRARYYRDFMDKWVAGFWANHKAGTILIKFDDLVGSARGRIMQNIVDMAGIEPTASIAAALSAHKSMREIEKTEETSTSTDWLYWENRELIADYAWKLRLDNWNAA